VVNQGVEPCRSPYQRPQLNRSVEDLVLARGGCTLQRLKRPTMPASIGEP